MKRRIPPTNFVVDMSREVAVSSSSSSPCLRRQVGRKRRSPFLLTMAPALVLLLLILLTMISKSIHVHAVDNEEEGDVLDNNNDSEEIIVDETGGDTDTSISLDNYANIASPDGGYGNSAEGGDDSRGSRKDNHHNNKNLKPNLIFIVTDQQRYDTLGIIQKHMKSYNKHVKVRTPNLDRLANMGVLFDTAYCGSSSCAPARAVLRTGNTLQRTGITRNRMVNDKVINRIDFIREKVESLTTFEQILADKCNYKVVTFGKWHAPKSMYYSKTNTNKRIVSYNYFDYKDNKFKFAPLQIIKPVYRYAVNYLIRQEKLSFPYRPGQQQNTLSMYPYTPIRLDPRYGRPTKTDLTKKNGFKQSELTFGTIYGRESLPSQFTVTGIAARMALRSLNQLIAGATATTTGTTTSSSNTSGGGTGSGSGSGNTDGGSQSSETEEQNQQQQPPQPFSLALHLLAPHPPILSTTAHAAYYTERQNRLFVSPSIKDPMKNSAYKNSNGRGKRGAFDDKDKVREVTAMYYGMIEEVDYWVGKIVQKLEEANILDNTLIVFTSDHGEMLGAHAMRNKFNLLEEASRVPLFMTYPKQIPARTRVKEPVMHMDIFATILDYLGASKYDNSDGKSLRRYIEGKSFNMHFDERIAVSEIDGRIPLGVKRLSGELGSTPNFLIRHRHWKLIITKKRNSRNIDMMYNLKNDEYEQRNLIGTSGKSAKPEVIGKAEHLKILLMEWLVRNNGAKKYYSSRKYNLGEGIGDVQEIRRRRQWRKMQYWQSDQVLQFGRPAYRNNKYRRNEFLYIGRTILGVLSIRDIKVVQKKGKGDFIVDKVNVNIKKNRYVRIKVSFASDENIFPMKQLNAYVQFRTNIEGKELVRVKII